MEPTIPIIVVLTRPGRRRYRCPEIGDNRARSMQTLCLRLREAGHRRARLRGLRGDLEIEIDRLGRIASVHATT